MTDQVSIADGVSSHNIINSCTILHLADYNCNNCSDIKSIFSYVFRHIIDSSRNDSLQKIKEVRFTNCDKYSALKVKA